MSKLLKNCIFIAAVISRITDGFGFICLDTISQCVCDPTKLHVDCSNLGFGDVPLADIPVDTSSFSFGGNLLTAIMQDTFANLESLLSLSLEENLIAYVHSGSFDAMRDLKSLDLSGNRLSSVPSALNALTSLRVLNLSGNSLSYLSASDFQNFTQLEILMLENNEIYSIPETTFYPLVSLGLLYMDGNLLSSDPVRYFLNCTLLTRLRMSQNSLPLTSNVEDWFGVGASVPLEELHLADNGIVAIHAEAFRSCVNLRQLNLSANEIETIAHGSFADLVQLQNVTLSENKLSALPDNLFQTTGGVLTLSLEGNSLSAMPSGVLNGLSQLVELNLAGNQLVDLFTTSCVGGDYTEFTCAANPPVLPTLKSLYLQENMLSSVPKVSHFYGLAALNLGDNLISEIEPYAFNGTSMRLLYLNDNLLTTISLDNFKFLPDLELVTVTGNPWTCNCLLHWIVDPEGEHLAWKTAVYDDIFCDSPNFAKHKDLVSLYFNQESLLKSSPFVPCETAVSWVIVVIIVVVWCVVFVVILVCYLRHSIDYHRGYYKRSVKKIVTNVETIEATTSSLPSAAFLNKGATIDELDKSTATEITFVMTASRADNSPHLQVNTDKSASRAPPATKVCKQPPNTVVTVQSSHTDEYTPL